MANKVEIIIQAVDKFTANIKKININLRDMARAGAAVAGGFALAYKALDSFGALAAKLHFDKTAEQINYMKRSLEDTQAALLQFNVAGMQIQAWLGQVAEGFGSLIRLIGVGLATALMTANTLLITTRFTLAELLPTFVKYTKEQMNADLATVRLAWDTNVARIATDGYAASLEKVNQKLAAASMRNVKLKNSVTDLWEANKKLRASYVEIEDAIRAGDARALAAAQRGQMGGGLRTGLSGPRANVASGASGSVDKGNQTIVNVIVDGEVIRSQTRKTMAEDIFKPTLKSGSGAKR